MTVKTQAATGVMVPIPWNAMKPEVTLSVTVAWVHRKATKENGTKLPAKACKEGSAFDVKNDLSNPSSETHKVGGIASHEGRFAGDAKLCNLLTCSSRDVPEKPEKCATGRKEVKLCLEESIHECILYDFEQHGTTWYNQTEEIQMTLNL